MNKSEALAFLRTNQPMPADGDWTAESEKLDDVRRFFIQHPDPSCVPLFLGVFGQGSGYGVYQRIEDVIRIFPSETVLPHLRKALETGTRSVRYWSAQIAAVFPDPTLIPALNELLREDDQDLMDAAITALGQVKDDQSRRILKHLWKNQDLDSDTRELIGDGLQNIEPR